MKLNEIKQVNAGEYDLKEGVIPVHITMALEHVMRDGKVTNPVQHFIMAGLAAMFKNGGPSRWPRDLNEYGMTTNADLIESVKQLSDKESVALAEWLYTALQAPANFEANPYTYANPQQHLLDWVKYVIKKQA